MDILIPEHYPEDIDTPFTFEPEQLHQGFVSLSQRYDVRTICNVIRRIHLLARSQEISLLCAQAIYMAKRMDAALRAAKHDYDRGWWQPDTPLPPPVESGKRKP
jgi:hypothetical protein